MSGAAGWSAEVLRTGGGVGAKLKKRTALLAKLKEIFRQNISQPVERLIEQINPIPRGWVNYFAVGDSSECFSSETG